MFSNLLRAVRPTIRPLFGACLAVTLVACGTCDSDSAAGGYTVGGTVSGLAKEARVTLLDSTGQLLVIDADGRFRFASTVEYNGNYSITIGTQPAGQVCSIANGAGSGVTADVDNLQVVCSAAAYAIGGTVTGLAAGRTLTLLNNGADAITVSEPGAWRFPTAVPFNGAYRVTVGTQPADQSCTVSANSGSGVTADVSSVNVVCSVTTHSVGGAVSGLASGQQVTLLLNGADPVTVAANGPFTFATAVASGGSSTATIGTHPAGQTCSISNPTTASVMANVEDIGVVCSTDTFVIGGSISGLASGAQVTLLNNVGDPLTVNADGGFTFATPVPWSGSYAVTIGTQPVGQTCSVVSGSGSDVQAAVNDVVINCAANAYTIGGTVSGLAASTPWGPETVRLRNNGGDDLVVANGSFTFPTAVPHGGAYAVTAVSIVGYSWCVVRPGSASGIATAPVDNVVVECFPDMSGGDD